MKMKASFLNTNWKLKGYQRKLRDTFANTVCRVLVLQVRSLVITQIFPPYFVLVSLQKGNTPIWILGS